MCKKHWIILAGLLFCVGIQQIQAAPSLRCGDYITTDVILTEDLHCVSEAVALRVGSNDITIDLNGHTLSGGGNEYNGSSTSAIRGSIYNNITIKGPGMIKDFWSGVESVQSENIEVLDVTFFELGVGVNLASVSEANIHDNDFVFISLRGVIITNNFSGKGFTANNNIINNNEFYKTNTGISICGIYSDYNTISNNLIWKTEEAGILLTNSWNNNVESNKILESDIAIVLSNSSYNKINNNSLKDGGKGVSLWANSLEGCSGDGARKSLTGKNNIINNRLFNFDTGISMFVDEDSDSRIDGTQISNNKIHYNSVGVRFGINTNGSYVIRENSYIGTTTPAIDHGTNNSY